MEPKRGGSEETMLTINVGKAILQTSTRRRFTSATDYMNGMIAAACSTCCGSTTTQSQAPSTPSTP